MIVALHAQLGEGGEVFSLGAAGGAFCVCLGGFRFDAPRDQLADIVALLARPVPSGGFELVVVSNQRIGF